MINISELVTFLNSFTSSLYKLNKIRISILLKDWYNMSLSERYKNTLKISLECFEVEDNLFKGRLYKKNIINFHKTLMCKLGYINTEYTDNEIINNLYIKLDNDILYNFIEWINYILNNLSSSDLPDKIYNQFYLFDKNHISICNWCNKIMYSNSISECYGNHNVICYCDYSLEELENTEVLHCPCEKNNNHPFGYDISKIVAKDYFNDLLDRRLESRMQYFLIDDISNDILYIEVKTKHIQLCKKLIPQTIKYYINIWKDISSNISILTNTQVTTLTKFLTIFRRILSYDRDIKDKLTNEIDKCSEILDSMDELNEDISVDNNIFFNEQEKIVSIQNYRKQYKNYNLNIQSLIINCSAINNIINSIYYENSYSKLDEIYNRFNTITNNYYESIEILEKTTPNNNIIEFETVVLDNNNTECIICKDNMNNNNNPVKLVKCGHIYHKECLLHWLKRKNECPICRVGK